MPAQIEDLSAVEKKLSVEIPWDQVKQKLDLAYRELGKGAEIRGFRKGKVPRPILERMYGRRVEEEVTKELVQESFYAAADEHNLSPVGEPVIEDLSMKSGEGLKYRARVEVRSPVDLKEWEGLAGTRPTVTVSEVDVDRAIEQARTMHTTYKPITGRTTAGDNDVLLLAISGEVGDHKIDRPEASVDLSRPDHEPLPGLAKALAGVALDAKDLVLDLPVPEDWHEKEVAGKTAKLTITIKDAREKEIPTLDDEFAKEMGEASLGDLRAKMREGLEKKAREGAERQLRDALLKDLVSRNPLELPPSLVERGIDSQIARAQLSLAMQGIELDKGVVGSDEMRERLRTGAADELRGYFLLDAIADKNSIEVTDADVDARVAEMAAAQGKAPARLKAELDKEGTLRSMKWTLRQERALDLVVARATITEGAPAPAETPAETPETPETPPAEGGKTE
jgi:trigger factor